MATYRGPHGDCRETMPHEHIGGRVTIDAGRRPGVCVRCGRLLPGNARKEWNQMQVCPFCGTPVGS